MTLSPLDELWIPHEYGNGKVVDAGGRCYAEITPDCRSAMTAGLTGIHRFIPDSPSVNREGHSWLVEAHTSITDDREVFGDLLQRLIFTIQQEPMPRTSYINGKVYRYTVPWLRDHVHTLKGTKYFEADLKSAIELYGDFPRHDGMIWDNINPRPCRENHWEMRWPGQEFCYTLPDGRNQFHRIPVEADVEYLFVEGLFETARATGDLAWRNRYLSTAERAFRYAVTSPERWSEKYQLVKRGYTIDTWDFQNEFDAQRNDTQDPMRIQLGKTQFGVMFGDNTGMAAAGRYLATAYSVDSEEARHYQRQAEGFESRTDELCWRGGYYQHHVREDDSSTVDLGVDERDQISLSNAYSANRISDLAKVKSIVQTYHSLKSQLPPGSVGEWFAIYPPFERGYGNHNAKWQYMNGGVLPIVAGELSRAAFRVDEARYGVDILERIYDLIKRPDRVLRGFQLPNESGGNILHGVYVGAPSPVRRGTFKPLSLRKIANRSFRSDVVEARPWFGEEGNDLRNFPAGAVTLAGVQFDILQSGAQAVVLGSDDLSSAEVPVKAIGQTLYLAHLVSRSSMGDSVGEVHVRYADGRTVRTSIIVGQHVLPWWQPNVPEQFGQRTLEVGWSGSNPKCNRIGVSICAIPLDPSSEVDSILFVAGPTSGKWAIVGVTLSPEESVLSDNPVSYGIPDGWGAAACIYALIEGLAGIVDRGIAMDDVLLWPRWTEAEVNFARATITYPASRGYVAYQYEATDDGLRITVARSGGATVLRVPLPTEVSGVESIPAFDWIRSDGTEGSFAEAQLGGELTYDIEVKFV